MANNDQHELGTRYFLAKMKQSGQYYSDNLLEMEIPPDILSIVPAELAFNYRIIPADFSDQDDTLTLVTDSEKSYKQKGILQQQLPGYKLRLLLTSSDNIRAALPVLYNRNTVDQNHQAQLIEEDITPIKASLNMMLQNAASQQASDIHIRPNSHNVQICFEINGHTYDMSSEYNFSANEASQVVNLIKQMDTSGSMDQTRTTMANEGSFSIVHGNNEIRVRIETLPIGPKADKEYIALRLLPPSVISSLDDIGYLPEDLADIKKNLYSHANGLFINSGPTGHGKTTSLYSQINYILSVINEPLNVITINDPIEILEEKFTQVQVRKAKQEDLSLTDTKILKAAMRCAPKIILYEEIRDSEAAKATLIASTSGHRVFSTIHANNCINTISRLLEFNVSKSTLLSELRMIISQRLVSKLCPYCSQNHELTELEKSILTTDEVAELERGIASGEYILKERGAPEKIKACGKCNRGFERRFAIAEYIKFNNELRDALLQQASFSDINAILKKQNFRSMWKKGLRAVVQGQIELSELISVIGRSTE